MFPDHRVGQRLPRRVVGPSHDLASVVDGDRLASVTAAQEWEPLDASVAPGARRCPVLEQAVADDLASVVHIKGLDKRSLAKRRFLCATTDRDQRRLRGR